MNQAACNGRYRVLVVLAALAAQGAFGLTYLENFDETNHWYKISGTGGMDEWNSKGYTNDITAPIGDRFTSDYGIRSTNGSSAPFAWEIAAASVGRYFRYECTNMVSSFSLALARVAGVQTPDIQIRYSNNSGASYTRLYSGSELLAGLDPLVYTQYVSTAINVSPRSGQKIYIEVLNYVGAPVLVDDFAHTYTDPHADTVFLIDPAPAVTTGVGRVVEFFAETMASGTVAIGYGFSTNGAGWTWLATGPTNLSYGYGATNSFWLTSDKWYYAARWISPDGTTTNYGWNDHGQVTQTTLAAQYHMAVTNYRWSTIWQFGYPGSTSPTQDPVTPESYLALAPGLVSNIPGDGSMRVDGFPLARDPASNVVFVSKRVSRQGMGFFFRALSGSANTVTVDVQYSANGTSWTDWLAGCPLPATDAWQMIGADNNAFSTMDTLHFRVLGYGSAGASVAFGEVQITALVPEPLALTVFILIAAMRRRVARHSQAILSSSPPLMRGIQ